MTKEKLLFFLSSGKMINTIQVKHKKTARLFETKALP